VGRNRGLGRGRCNLLRRSIEIKESASEVGGKLHFGATKTYETRTIPLPGFLIDKLARHMKAIPDDPGALVFTTEQGQPLRGSNWRFRVWLPALKRAGIKPLRIHDLRHTCASLLIAQGHSPNSIQAHPGHSSITVTLDIYGHLYPEEREKIAAGLEEAYRAAKERNYGVLITLG
jgi:integrase